MSKVVVGKTGARPSPHDKRDLPYRAVAKQLATAGQLRVPQFSYDNRWLKRWPMLGNDRYGCCTFAGIVRIMMNNAARRGKTLAVEDKHVINAYLDYNDGQDNGGVPVEVLTYMKNVGIKLDDGTHLKVRAFARVDNRDVYEWNSAIQTFGHLYVAAGLPARLDEDRDRRLELTPFEKRDKRDEPRSMGGHAYNIFGFQRREQFAVMWTDDLVEELDWTNYYREEGWVFIDNQETDETLLQVMQEQLAAIKAQ